jgi:hypothetical protein
MEELSHEVTNSKITNSVNLKFRKHLLFWRKGKTMVLFNMAFKTHTHTHKHMYIKSSARGYLSYYELKLYKI